MKKGFKSKLYVIGAFTLIFNLLFTSIAGAAPLTNKTDHPSKTVIQVQDPETFAKKQGLVAPSPNAKLVSITLSIDESTVNQSSTSSSLVSPDVYMGGYYLSNVVDTGNSCGLQVLRDSYYTGPSTATMTISQGVSSQWSSNVGVTADVVSAGVGFNVTQQYTVTDSYSTQVPSGYTYEIVAHPVFDNKNFDVYYHPFIGSDYYAGYGQASKPVGVCFVVYSY